MSIVEIDAKYRVTIPSEARKVIPVRAGQEAYIVPYGEAFLVVPLEQPQSVTLRRKIREIEEKGGKTTVPARGILSYLKKLK